MRAIGVVASVFYQGNTSGRVAATFWRTFASSALAVYYAYRSIRLTVMHGDPKELTSHREQFGPENRVRRGSRMMGVTKKARKGPGNSQYIRGHV